MTGNRIKQTLGLGGALLLLTCLSLQAQIPVNPHDFVRGLDSPEGIDPASTAPSGHLQAQVLATFELSGGSTVSFLTIPKLGEIGYSELVPPGAVAALGQGSELSALDVYLALAPVDLPVPRALVELDARRDAAKLVAGRTLTDRLAEPVFLLSDDLGLEAAGLRNLAGASHLCGSAADFASQLCKAQAGHNCGLIDFCDSGMWSSLTRNSYLGGWQKREASYGWTAACGTAVEVRQLWWHNSAWEDLSETLVPDGGTYYVIWHGPAAYRKIIRARLSSTGGFRAYTNFHNDC